MTGAVALLALALAGCGKERRVAMFPPPSPGDLARGAALYQAQCALCHGPEAQGNPPVFKPLLESASVKGDGSALARIVLRSDDHIDPRNGQNFFTNLDDEDLARILNHLRHETGEGLPPLRGRTVHRERP
jgi:mono/diheme cytochrome c family protein